MLPIQRNELSGAYVPLLEHRRGRARRAQLVPADAAAGRAGDRVIDEQRFVVAEVAIDEAIHQSDRRASPGPACRAA